MVYVGDYIYAHLYGQKYGIIFIKEKSPLILSVQKRAELVVFIIETNKSGTFLS